MSLAKPNKTNQPHATNSSHKSHASHSGSVIPAHGGYEQLRAFQKSQIIYDATVRFCDRFVDWRSRTHDQMVQAARSGNKNIAEGSQVSGTSKEAELKLTNVARASLEELLGDYRDYLRQHGHAQWQKIRGKPFLCASSARAPMRAIPPFSPISILALPKQSPTSSSASFTRQTTCSTSNCAV